MREKTQILSPPRVIAVLVGSAVLVFATTALFGLFNPRDTSQPEGAVIAAALRLAHGEPLYMDIHEGPYLTAMYGPFLYLTLGGMFRLLGAGVSAAYLSGRILSLLSALGCTILVTSLARRHGAARSAAWAAGGLFLASPLIVPLAYSARADVPALALALSGVALFERWAGSKARYLAAIPLVAAVFTKQTALAAVLGICLSLIWARRWGQALRLAGAVALPSVLILALLNHFTRGLAFQNLFEVPGASPLSLVRRPVAGLIDFAMFAALPLVLVIPLWPRIMRGEERLKLPICYSFSALLVSLAAVTKLGSGTYYFMEPMAAILILSAVGLSRILEHESRTREGLSGLLVAGLFVVLLAGSMGTMVRQGVYRYDSNADVIELAQATPGELLIEDENVALKSGKPVTIMDAFAFAYMQRRGRWDAGPLNRRILNRDFDLIILRSPIEHPSHYQGETYWCEETLAAIDDAYHSQETVDGYVIYRRRSEPETMARQREAS